MQLKTAKQGTLLALMSAARCVLAAHTTPASPACAATCMQARHLLMDRKRSSSMSCRSTRMHPLHLRSGWVQADRKGLVAHLIQLPSKRAAGLQ